MTALTKCIQYFREFIENLHVLALVITRRFSIARFYERMPGFEGRVQGCCKVSFSAPSHLDERVKLGTPQTPAGGRAPCTPGL